MKPMTEILSTSEESVEGTPALEGVLEVNPQRVKYFDDLNSLTSFLQLCKPGTATYRYCIRNSKNIYELTYHSSNV